MSTQFIASKNINKPMNFVWEFLRSTAVSGGDDSTTLNINCFINVKMIPPPCGLHWQSGFGLHTNQC